MLLKKTPVPEVSEQTTEIQNLMELIDIKKIVRDLVQEELQRLGIINLPVQKNKVFFNPNPEEEYIDDPMDVDLTWVENAKDLATVEGKIGDSAISVVVDSTSNKDIMLKFVADELGIEIDTSIIH